MRTAAMPLERDLEDVIEADPDILGEPVLLIGRQVPTAHGGFVDLLAVDGEGCLRVLELKRDRTPREVIAQALDYASWAASLSHAQILRIFADYRADETTFESAFEERFGVAAPEELNAAHRVTIVAARLDEATERIVGYLADLGAPVNAVFFHYYEDDGHRYLARTWLRDEAKAAPAPRAGKSSTREPWNGVDWYSAFGEEGGTRSWDDARRFGFVSAGGGKWFSQGLRRPRLGDRVNVYIPKVGYVGVGEVCGEPAPFTEAVVGDGSVRLAEQQLVGTYRHAGDENDPDVAEYVLPVRWLKTVDRSDSVTAKGIFALQHPMCRLSNATTLAILNARFFPERATT
ncbi:endonuclease NucS domain-containing protein [Streptomyces sp. SID3343]|uniref:endonuclease NucS domain-containing protein n=1 Tax=Streptomyces sp. SID3343 TaxID=2690260 RepID=UPI001F029347|nr:endonuclease NucS domain-containing protein [Streptomyces sp. SID3343]